MGRNKTEKSTGSSRQSAAAAKKRQTRLWGFATIVLYLLCAVCSKENTPFFSHLHNSFFSSFPLQKQAGAIAVFVFSCATVTSKTRTGANTTILNGESATHPRPCRDVAAFKEHAPLRFVLGNDTGALGCPWRARNSGVRMALCLVATAAAGAGFFFTFFRRARRTALVGVLTAAAAAGFGYVLYIDAADVAHSRAWCRQGMPGVPWVRAPAAKHCAYGPLVLVPVLDAVTALCWALLTVCAVAFVCRAGPGRASLARRRLLPSENGADDDDEGGVDDPYAGVGASHYGDEGEGDDAGAVPSADSQQQGKRRGGLFGFFRGGNSSKRQQRQDGDEGGKEMTSEPVNFEAESASRFAPMSRTDRKTKKSLPLGESGAGTPGAATGNALFNFEDMDSEQQQTPQGRVESQPSATVESAHKGAETVDAAPAAVETQQQQGGGGMFDFDALAEQQEKKQQQQRSGPFA